MGIALTLHEYLDDNHIPFEVMKHPRTHSASRTAEASHIPGGCMAKGVVLKWDDGYILAVVPASRQIDMAKVRAIIGENVELASEAEASMLFPDCDTGAVPALGVPYRVTCMVDEELEGRSDIYFEGGDHTSLVHLPGDEFGRLMYGVPHGHISH
ncbi:aminoacyl-tRNA deacylase [Oricola cellulosilytica]|uniref:YbaK/EbsC family protein n=1 Tax=Oricola cellulosilytica TaxID=1429082 RepID=A0A4R0PC27_9HYPH|nr:YbaK/EbsC family protein [Oricola cellulosilytica]TCD13718.1 YbaK/EbsC family protein [Oricola cellulosilytica]